jgi:hypothetical protein
MNTIFRPPGFGRLSTPILFAAALLIAGTRVWGQADCQYLLNLNFKSGTRTGMAATWNWTDDKWNVVGKATNVVEYWQSTPIKTYTTVTGLVWADNSAATGVSVTVTNLTGEYVGRLSNYGYPDTMADNLLSSYEILVDEEDPCCPCMWVTIYANPKVVISGMPSNTYDIYLYALNQVEIEFETYVGVDEGFRVQVGTGDPTAWKRTAYSVGAMNTNWTEDVHYVKFANLTVNNGENIVISLSGTNYSGVHVLEGLQIIQAGGGPTNCPPPTISPESGSYTSAINVTITNSQADASYYYKLNGSGWGLYTAPIQLAENTTVIAQARRHGNLDSLEVTNTYTFPDNDGDGLTDAREGLIGTSPTNSDTDYDGRTDGQEYLVDGTDPLNANSVEAVRLAYFRFNTNTWVGEAGQLPTVSSNLHNPTSWDGKALLVNTNGTTAFLKYQDKESDQNPNINLQKGTVRFWFKPDWGGTNTGGSGPGSLARLIEVGYYTNDASYGQWVIAFNAEGTELSFGTQGGGVETNHFTAAIEFASNVWHQIVITHTATNSILYLDGQAVTNGPGVVNFPNATVRAADGLRLGTDVTGNQQAKGMFEELETFNYPLSAYDIKQNFDAVAGRDTDGDGVSDIQEHENGTDPNVSNLPFYVIITQPKPGSILP